jgi:hypothetical protein
MRKLMLKKSGWAVLLTFVLIGDLFTSASGALKLYGTAEDQWGNQIDLAQLNKGIVVIHPLSTSH